MADRTIQTATRKRDDYPLVFVNDSGETIPPFAVMEVSSVDEVTVDGAMLFHVVKPTGSNKAYIFNGPFNISDGKRGRGRNAGAIKAACTVSPTVGDNVGPTSGSWLVTTGKSGFVFIDGGGSDGIAIITVGSAGGNGVMRFGTISTAGSAATTEGTPTTDGEIDLYGGATVSFNNYYPDEAPIGRTGCIDGNNNIVVWSCMGW